MHDNSLNTCNSKCQYPVQQNPNAVSINIFSPSAYGNQPALSGMSANQGQTQNVPYLNYPNYPIYSSVPISNSPLYPQNYNNLINYPSAYPNNQAGYNNQTPAGNYNQNPAMSNPNVYYPASDNQNGLNNQKINLMPNNSGNNVSNELNASKELSEKNTDNTVKGNNDKNSSEKTKKIIPLTDDYIKSLENYLDSNNSKVRLMGIKGVIDRFKEDENRKDNPSLIPLLNKALQDTSPSVRFLALTALQLDYTKGDDITVQILKNLVNNSKENFGEDAILASEALLKIATPEAVAKGGMQ